MPMMDSLRRHIAAAFREVGLRNNKGKMLTMACWPCHTPPVWSTEAYTRRLMGRGLSYRERLQQRVYCLECGVDLAAGLLTTHRQRQHGVGSGKATPPPSRGGEGGEIENRGSNSTPEQYRVPFPNHHARLRCPVERCQETASS